MKWVKTTLIEYPHHPDNPKYYRDYPDYRDYRDYRDYGDYHDYRNYHDYCDYHDYPNYHDYRNYHDYLQHYPNFEARTLTFPGGQVECYRARSASLSRSSSRNRI